MDFYHLLHVESGRTVPLGTLPAAGLHDELGVRVLRLIEMATFRAEAVARQDRGLAHPTRHLPFQHGIGELQHLLGQGVLETLPDVCGVLGIP